MPDAGSIRPTQTIVSSRYGFQGRRIAVRVDDVRLEDGTEFTREVVEHPGAVAIVPMLPDGRVVLVRQWRHAVDRELLEIPAGTLEEGEPPLECARRELVEETGYQAGTMQPLVAFCTSPGFTNEVLHLFVAGGLSPTSMNLDEGEIIKPVAISWSEAMAMCTDGHIQDAKTLVGLLAADRLLRPDATR